MFQRMNLAQHQKFFQRRHKGQLAEQISILGGVG
jgi:hypothetical protein